MFNKFEYFGIALKAVLTINSVVLATAQDNVEDIYVIKCPNSFDKRTIDSDPNEISIPFSRTSQQAYFFTEGENEQAPFTIKIEERNSESRLKCFLENSVTRNIAWKLRDNELRELQPRNFYNVTIGSSDRHQHSYFTESGHFYDASTGNYYNPSSDYCVQSISNENIILRVCTTNCSNPSNPNTYCLPKCCALDETLLFWKRKCVRLPETEGMTPWQPPIYKGVKNPDKRVNLQQSLVYHMTELPKKCDLMMTEDGKLHENGYGLMSAVNLKHPKLDNVTEEKQHFKLILPSDQGGMLGVMIFNNESGEWMEEKIDHFCVEGFYVKTNDTPTYTGETNNFVLFYCVSESDGYDLVEKGNVGKSWMYLVVSLISMVFLLATIIVYGALWDKHNLHGLTIASYIGSTFGAYLLLSVAHMIYLYQNEEFTGVYERGPFCYTVATLAHYFYLSTYFWLTVMNLDLWMTLSSMKTVRRDNKEWGKFGIYSGIGWGLPLLLIIAFVVVDHEYRDSVNKVPVPNYAHGSCFVSGDSRGEYVFTPMAIILGFNFVLIAMTMWIFLKAGCRKSSSVTIANKYNMKLFVKLFIVMGGTSLIDFLTWIYNDKDGKPWIIITMEAISYLTPVAFFFLFCLNEKVIVQLREKYPRFTAKISPLLKIFGKDNKSHSFDETSAITASTNQTKNSALNGIDENQDNIQLQSLVQK